MLTFLGEKERLHFILLLYKLFSIVPTMKIAVKILHLWKYVLAKLEDFLDSAIEEGLHQPTNSKKKLNLIFVKPTKLGLENHFSLHHHLTH